MSCTGYPFLKQRNKGHNSSGDTFETQHVSLFEIILMHNVLFFCSSFSLFLFLLTSRRLSRSINQGSGAMNPELSSLTHLERHPCPNTTALCIEPKSCPEPWSF